MAANQVIGFRRGRLSIACLSGLVWLTDGATGERIIKSGQRVVVKSSGKICIQAFEPSEVLVQQKAVKVPVKPFLTPAVLGPRKK
jgi:hypothetical protein